MGPRPAWARQQCLCLFLRAGRVAARVYRRGTADRRPLCAARLGLLEVSVRALRPVGHHPATIGALLPGAKAVRLYRGRLAAGRAVTGEAARVRSPPGAFSALTRVFDA